MKEYNLGVACILSDQMFLSSGTGFEIRDIRSKEDIHSLKVIDNMTVSIQYPLTCRYSTHSELIGLIHVV